jgi:bifunctional UDP-N-acetylglucosamine pyrophosphorylase/glucosamine-1-phosphate N-acetyltransferase
LKAVVLAAGEGTRIWPLATTKPKHLLPIAGKPLISYTLQALADNGVKDVFLVVGHKGEVIRSALGEGARYGVHITYVEQLRRTGTASALRLAAKVVGDQPFLALYGDLLVSSSAVQTVIEKSRECSKVVSVVRLANPSQYGVVELRRDRVVRISEKPANIRKEAWVIAGIYGLDKEVLQTTQKTAISTRREYELTTSLQSLLDRGTDIRSAVIAREDWMDIGRPWDLIEANERILATLPHRVNGTVETGAVLKGTVSLEESGLVKSGSYIEGPAYIGKESKVGPNARIRPFTSIGDNVAIGTSCEVKNSIIMNGTRVPHLSYVGDSVIGENCNLGAGTITANIRLDERVISLSIKGRMQSTERKKLGVIMGDGVQTGINSSIMPGVRIGSDSFVGPGTIIFQDIPESQAVYVKQTLMKRPKQR